MARKSRKGAVDGATQKPPPQVQYRVGAYARISAKDGGRTESSVETQQDIMNRHIAKMPDVCSVQYYVDEGETGTNFRRPGFLQLTTDIESGKINCVVVKDLSRFGRNFIEAGVYMEQYFPKHGVRFIAVTDGHDSLIDDGGVLLHLKNAIAEEYARDCSTKVRASKRQRMKAGLQVGGIPYGYVSCKKEAGKLEIDPYSAQIVKDIFKQALAGTSIQVISTRLNALGVLSPNTYRKYLKSPDTINLDNPSYWGGAMVTRILTNKVYIGDLIQKSSAHGAFQEEVISIENNHPPIISRDAFESVQKLRLATSAKKQKDTANKVPFPPSVLTGKIKCGTCGRKMKRKICRNKKDFFFMCNTNNSVYKGACVSLSVHEKVIIESCMNALADYVYGVETKDIQGKLDVATRRLSEVESRKRSLNHYTECLYESLVNGTINAIDYEKMKASYLAETVQINEEKASLETMIIRKRGELQQQVEMSKITSESRNIEDVADRIIPLFLDWVEVTKDREIIVHLVGDEAPKLEVVENGIHNR